MNFPTASCSARSRAVSIVSGSSTTNTPSHHLPLNFPLAGFQNREFRVGYDLTTDVQKAYRPQCRLWRNPPGIPPHRIWWVAAVISGFVQPHLAATLHREGNSEASGDVRSVCPGLAASVGGPCRNSSPPTSATDPGAEPMPRRGQVLRLVRAARPDARRSRRRISIAGSTTANLPRLDYPPDHQRLFLKKRLEPETA